MLDAGLLVTVNSDDPAYFGGYVGRQLRRRTRTRSGSTGRRCARLARNSFRASFLDEETRAAYLKELDAS